MGLLLRNDGWPLCQDCEEDELAITATDFTESPWAFCYRCSVRKTGPSASKAWRMYWTESRVRLIAAIKAANEGGDAE
jgi:hypothetical protein